MQNLNPRIRVPREIREGEVFEVRTLVSHIMESGQRVDSTGNRVPRHIVNRLVCLYDGEEVFRAELHPGIAMDPYVSFRVRARGSGELTLIWTDDAGESHTETVPVTVA